MKLLLILRISDSPDAFGGSHEFVAEIAASLHKFGGETLRSAFPRENGFIAFFEEK